MNRMWVLLLVTVGLAACGVDGPPRAPEATGVSVTGDVRVGMQAEL